MARVRPYSAEEKERLRAYWRDYHKRNYKRQYPLQQARRKKLGRIYSIRTKVNREVKKVFNREEYLLKQRWSIIKHTFGLTEDDYNAMLVAQGGLCAICKQFRHSTRSKFLHIDHCHKSGKVRGLLCNLCNLGLGAMREDSNAIANMLAYIETHAHLLNSGDGEN